MYVNPVYLSQPMTLQHSLNHKRNTHFDLFLNLKRQLLSLCFLCFCCCSIQHETKYLLFTLMVGCGPTGGEGWHVIYLCLMMEDIITLDQISTQAIYNLSEFMRVNLMKMTLATLLIHQLTIHVITMSLVTSKIF